MPAQFRSFCTISRGMGAGAPLVWEVTQGALYFREAAPCDGGALPPAKCTLAQRPMVAGLTARDDLCHGLCQVNTGCNTFHHAAAENPMRARKCQRLGAM